MKTVEKVKEVKNEEIISGNDMNYKKGQALNIIMLIIIIDGRVCTFLN